MRRQIAISFQAFFVPLEGSNPSETDVNIPLLGFQCWRNIWDHDHVLHKGYPLSRNWLVHLLLQQRLYLDRPVLVLCFSP